MSLIQTMARLPTITISLLLVLLSYAGCQTDARQPAKTVPIPIVTSPRPATSGNVPLPSITPQEIATPVKTATLIHSPTLVPTATPILRGSIAYGFVGGGDRFNPFSASSTGMSSLLSLVWESLLRVDPHDGSLRPGLAESWAVSRDGMTITFTLRQGVQWHGGDDLSPADVVSTLRYLQEPANRSPWLARLHNVQGVSALGGSGVRITLKAPACSTLYDVGLIPIWTADHTTHRQGSLIPVGTGPFELIRQEDDGSLLLRRNPSYRESLLLEEIRLYEFESAKQLEEAWKRSEIDVADYSSHHISILDNSGNQFIHFPGHEYLLLVYNLERSPLDDRRVREALRLSLDREAMIHRLNPAGGTLLATSLLSDHWAVADASVSPPTYDPHRARELLSLAGWQGLRTGDEGVHAGDELSLAIIANGENGLRVDTGYLVAEAYRAIGVESEIHVLQWGLFLDALFRGQFDVAVFSWPFPLDPDQRLFWHSSERDDDRGFNFSSWQDEEKDALLEQGALTASCDPAVRSALYSRFARLLADNHAADPLFVPHRQIVVRKGIVGLSPSPFAGVAWNVFEWRRY